MSGTSGLPSFAYVVVVVELVGVVVGAAVLEVVEVVDVAVGGGSPAGPHPFQAGPHGTAPATVATRTRTQAARI